MVNLLLKLGIELTQAYKNSQSQKQMPMVMGRNLPIQWNSNSQPHHLPIQWNPNSQPHHLPIPWNHSSRHSGRSHNFLQPSDIYDPLRKYDECSTH